MKNRIKFVKNDKAVSPVIGVILMVAITVILAAVIAAFVFGMGTPTATPQANLKLKEAKVATTNLTIEHDGGDSLKLSDIRFVVYNTTIYKNTIDPFVATTDATALSAGSTLIVKLNDATPEIFIDTTTMPTVGTITTTTVPYTLTRTGDTVTVELWYKPSGQQIAKLEAGTR